MKGIIKRILTIILLIQIIFTSIIATNNSYAVSDLIPENNNVTQPTVNSTTNSSNILGSLMNANSIYSSSDMVGDPAELPEDLTLPEFPNDTNNDDSNDGEAGLLEKTIDGVAGILLLPVKVLPLLIGKVLQWIMNIVAGEGVIGTLSVGDILFNKLTLTDINFFNLSSGDTTVDQIRRSVSIWYYSIRNLSAIILLAIIVYVGIRMALSTIAEDKAKYKQMLIDWLVGFALLFVLHYIMVFIVNVNNSIVDVLAKTLTENRSIN